MLKIEAGVPIPLGAGGKYNRKYPFPDMKPGDSFLINGLNHETVRMASYAYGKVHGQKFSVCKTTEGYRCWRIK